MPRIDGVMLKINVLIPLIVVKSHFTVLFTNLTNGEIFMINAQINSFATVVLMTNA